MTKEELIAFLRSIGVNKNSYSLNEGLKVNALILDKLDGLWKCFYYDEKGNETPLNYFKTEDEAYSYIKKYYLSDLEILGKTSF